MTAAHSSKKLKVTITGSNGFIGSLLLQELDHERYDFVGFDRFDGWLYRLLNKRHFQPIPLEQFTSIKGKIIRRLWRYQKRILSRLILWQRIRPSGIDILDDRNQWIKRFTGCDVVIHLAAIPHPNYPNMTPADYEQINYGGSVNIFEAAVAAGVKKFIFASSGQVYDINNYRDWQKFPVLEEEADLIQETTTVHPYSKSKWKFEQYLEERSVLAGVTSLSLRLEYPGVFGGHPQNLWVQTSVENLVQAFDKSLQAPLPAGSYVFNICNGAVPVEIGYLADLVPLHWPNVHNECWGNQSLFHLGRARDWIDYNPVYGRSYYMAETVF